MKYYKIFAHHIKKENESVAYLYTDEFLKASNQVDKFYLDYLEAYLYKSSPRPTFNPLEGVMFKCGKRNYDVYRSIGKLGRHFIISSRFKAILEEYNLSGHVCFDGVTIKQNRQDILQYHYLSFYESMWDHVSIEHCEFYKWKTFVGRVDDKFYTFKTIEEYNDANQFDHLRPSILVFKNLERYDFFPLFNYSDDLSFFISERLALRIKKEKILGGDVSEFTAWEFISI